jgi:hypothetical protein
VQVNNQWMLLQQAQSWNYLEQFPDGGYTELILWHSFFRTAGRADRVEIETSKLHAKKRYMHFEDHKTNEKPLRKESYQHPKTGQHKMMLYPLHKIMDCKFWKYALQLSLYQLMGESMGFLPGERRILHYGLTDFEILQGKETLSLDEMLNREPLVENVEYLKKDVISMCTHYNKTLKRRA